MGAKVALQLALDAPQLVKALILLAPVAAGPANFSEKGVAFLRSTVGHPDNVRKWLTRTLKPDPPAEILDRLSLAAARVDDEAALQSFESWSTTDLSEASRGIRIPAVVIAPEHDDPKMQQERVAALLPNARFTILEDSAHYAQLEQPEAIAKIIREVIERL